MKRFAIACVAVLGLAVMGASSANAGDIHVSFGKGGFGKGFHKGPSFHHGHGHHGHHKVHVRPPLKVWHDTSHYDWVPGHWVLIHGQPVWVPGQYVLHQTGHVDVIHRGRVHHHAH